MFKGYALTDPNVLRVTIAEVLDEIRDAKGRDAVAASAGALEVAEPSEEAIEAVKRFASKTGDVHALSRVDMKLIALAYDSGGKMSWGGTFENGAGAAEDAREKGESVREAAGMGLRAERGRLGGVGRYE